MDNMGLTRYMSVLMDDAMKQARFFDHEFVMPEHMLLALLRQYAFCQALQEEGVDSLKMHEDLVEWLAKQERVPETIKYLPEPSSLFKTMFGTACALAAAADRQHAYCLSNASSMCSGITNSWSKNRACFMASSIRTLIYRVNPILSILFFPFFFLAYIGDISPKSTPIPAYK
jgi:ATP-dependent Clp protease ATP-binding subunit ClpA